MRRVIHVLVLISLLGCGDQTARKHLGKPARIEVYMHEALDEHPCDHTLPEGALVSDTLADLETDGFANIQIDKIPAHKKLFFVVTARDPISGDILGHGCTENFEVDKNAIRDLRIILNKPSPGEGQ
jgi:hypothetical protein